MRVSAKNIKVQKMLRNRHTERTSDYKEKQLVGYLSVKLNMCRIKRAIFMIVREMGSGMTWPKAPFWKLQWIKARFQKVIRSLCVWEGIITTTYYKNFRKRKIGKKKVFIVNGVSTNVDSDHKEH